MPDRSSRSQRGGGFISISGLTPPELPDYQSDLNKQLSFLKSMDAYMNPGGSGGGTIRNANGLTPYQQAQLDYKLAKDAAKAAEAEAKKNVIVGTNPKTGQPMVYRNETGYKLSDKRMQEIYAGMLEDELRKDIANDEELNRIKGIAFGPKPISIDYRKQLERQYRDRTKALAAIYKIDDRAAFDAAFGEQSKSIRNEQQRALNEDSFLSVLGSGVAQGWSDFLNAMKMPFLNETERLETARQSLKERQERIAASPTLREREMEEQEAAEQGKDISYWQATDKNRASNLAASVAGTLTSFAVPVGLSMAAAPFTGGASLTGLSSLATAVPIAATGVLGAGMNQLGQAQRAAQDPDLTEEQKADMLSISDPGFALTTGIGGLAGALMPGGVGSGIVRGAGNAAFRRAAAAGPINPATVPGLTGRALRAGAKAAERANAPRSLGTLARDIAVNSGENAAIMGANTLGANAAYNVSTDKPWTQDITQGALGAIGEGAIIGVPFGGARTLRRPRVARAEAPAAVESAAETPSNTGETPAPQTPAAQPQSTTWTQRLRTDSGFNNWSNALVQETRTNNAAAVDKLVAEYLAGGGRLEDLELIRDSYAKDSKKRLVSDAEFAKAHDGLGHVRVNDELGWGSKNDEGINAAIARWKEAENNGALDSKIAGAFTGETGESRVAGIMAELESARAGSTAGQGNNADSAMETNTNADAESTANRTPVPDSEDNSGIESKRPRRESAPDLGQTKGNTEDAGQEAAKQKAGVVPANAGSARSRSGKAGDGTGSELNPAVGRDGGPSDAAANSGQQQPPSQPVATRGTPKSGKNKGTPDTLVVDGATFVRQPGVKSWKLRTMKGKKTSDLTINTKSATPGMPDSIKALKPSKRNEELTRLFNENVDNGIREARGWHGSGADFDAFDLSYVRKGTGATTHGYGVYIALENADPRDTVPARAGRDVGEEYRTSLANDHNPGRLYEVEVPDLDVMLQEHRPMSEQSAKVQKSVSRLIDDITKDGSLDRVLADIDENLNEPAMSKPSMAGIREALEYTKDIVQRIKQKDSSLSGRELYDAMYASRIGAKESDRSDMNASLLLNKYGIEGIYYMSQQDGPVAVVFNDKAVEILSKERRFGQASALSDKLIEKYFRTPEEKAVLAALRDKTTDAATYQSAVEQFANIVMSRFPGLKKRDLVMLPYSREANATYDPVSGNIGLNPGRIWDASDSVAASLNFMTHELLGHAATNELLSPTARRDLYGTAYRGATEAQRSDAITFYGDTAISAETAGKTSRGAYIGEEIYSEFHAANGNDPFVTNGDVRRDILDFYSLTPVNATERVQAMQKILDFLATHADDNTFKEFATSAILSSKEHVDAFTGSESKLLQLQDDGAVSASMVKMIEDYRDLTRTYGVERNKETLGLYLDELLDPETVLDVFNRQSVVC